MSKTRISAATRRFVEERAGYRCELCLVPIDITFFPHEVDHLIAEKHQGKTEPENLALVCWRCNRHKGSDLGSFDPLTRQFCFLFNPRTQIWSEHFILQDHEILGTTPEGRTTVSLLQLNTNQHKTERQRFMASPDM